MLRYLMPVVVALVWAGACSYIPEPHRRQFNAVVVGGAGAAYISGGSFGLMAPKSRTPPKGTEEWQRGPLPDEDRGGYACWRIQAAHALSTFLNGTLNASMAATP
jgi:hypothetical protein